MPARIPIIVLAGSDSRPGPVPRELEADDMLHGYKGAMPLSSGRPLVGELVGRLRASDRFDDPIVIGPRRVYEGHVDCEVVDVEGNLALTLEAVRELIRSRFDLSTPLALSTCDILPTSEEIDRLLAERYEPHAACSFWGQLIVAEPEQMGASCWKPSYHFLPDVGQPPANMYPGQPDYRTAGSFAHPVDQPPAAARLLASQPGTPQAPIAHGGPGPRTAACGGLSQSLASSDAEVGGIHSLGLFDGLQQVSPRGAECAAVFGLRIACFSASRIPSRCERALCCVLAHTDRFVCQGHRYQGGVGRGGRDDGTTRRCLRRCVDTRLGVRNLARERTMSRVFPISKVAKTRSRS